MGINWTAAGSATGALEATEAGAPAVEATEPAVATEEAAPVEVAAPPARVILESDLEASLHGCEGAAPGELASCLGRELQSRGYEVQGQVSVEAGASAVASAEAPAEPKAVA